MTKIITNYHGAVAFLESLSNLSTSDRQTPKIAGKNLKKVRAFLKFIGNPEKKMKIVHIAGTSGKGSVTTMLHSILQAAGKKVGSYTSPHTTTFCERIKAGDKYISKKELVRLVNFLKDKMDEYVLDSRHSHGIRNIRIASLNFFESSFVLALLYFQKMKCEYAAIETGCGGRYDATNIIQKPIYTIITNIGSDHLDIIGPTLKDVAYEKAGIIKRGAPLLTGERRKKLLKLFARELKKITNYELLITNYKNLKNIKTDLNGTEFEYNNERYKLRLLGAHQAENAALAIECAGDLGVGISKIKSGLLKTFYPARLEVISKKPLIIIDGAHNADKLQAGADFIKTLKYKNIKTKYLILGTAKNKEIKNFPEFFKNFNQIYLTRFGNPFRKCRGPSDWLGIIPKGARNKIKYFHLAKDALLDILPKLRNNDLLLITGSIFLAGELREYWYPEEKIIKNRKSVF